MIAQKAQAKSIFLNALEIAAPHERNVYLDSQCGADDTLRQEVEALLRHQAQAGAFLESPALHLATVDTTIRERPGVVIGPYKLLQQLGEGGMGIVFLAEQTQPVQRKVALKVIKPGMDTRQVIARFEAERQALALMDHVNIARVLDAGTTGGARAEGRGAKAGAEALALDSRHSTLDSSDGRPYFVMELVHGVPITRYCDDSQLTLTERLELFLPVCQAIQHAHQKGIIHRDIKPSNIMVTLYDGKPVPKVIDFGVAKATEQKLTERTLFTLYGTMVGTPQYMSPEQAEMSALGVDTRSDIYSLGVLLYELLTGTTPLSHQRLREAAYADVLRMIKEEEPPKPSTRLSDSGQALKSISDQRRSEPAKLTRLVRGELDWIVMKCLDKDRNRRYETALGLAADVQRYLSDEPVQACPPSVAYRLRKFTRRNRAALVTAGLLTLAGLVAIGSLAGSVGWIVRDKQTRLAATTRQVEQTLAAVESLYQQGKLPEAIVMAQKAHGIVESSRASADLHHRVEGWLRDLDMVDKLDAIRLRWTNNEVGYVAEFHQVFRDFGIDVSSLTVNEAAARIVARPIRLDLVAAVEVWAWSDDPTHRPELQRKLEVIARMADPDPWRNEVRTAVTAKNAAKLRELATSADLEHLPQASLEMFSVMLQGEQRIAFLTSVQRRYPDNFRINLDLGTHLRFLDPPRLEDALRFATVAVAIRPASAMAHENLGAAWEDKGFLDEAIAAYRESIRLNPSEAAAYRDLGGALTKKGILGEAVAACRKAIRLNPALTGSYDRLAIALVAQGLPDEAIESYRESLRVQPDDAKTHYNLGLALRENSRLDEAIAAYREAIRLKPDYAMAHANLGAALYKQGMHDEAIACYREAIRLRPATYQAHYNLGMVLAKQGTSDEAIAAYREAIRFKADYVDAHYDLGVALSAKGLTEEAVAAYREAIRFKPDFAKAHGNLGVTLARQGLLKEAVVHYREAIRLDPDLHSAYFNLGLTLTRQRALDEAVVAFRECLERQRRAVGGDHPDTLRALDKLSGLYQEQGKHSEAEPLLRQRLENYERKDPENWRRFDTLSQLGACVAEQQEYADAEPLLIHGYEGMKQRAAKIPAINRGVLTAALGRLVHFYETTAGTEQAAEWRKQLTERQEAERNPAK